MKKIMIIAMVLAFIVSAFTSAMASDPIICTVYSIEEEDQIVTITCEEADRFEAGDTVRLRPTKETDPVECTVYSIEVGGQTVIMTCQEPYQFEVSYTVRIRVRE